MAAAPPFEYAPAPEARETARLRPSYGIFVGGEFRPGAGGTVPTIDPSTAAPLADVAEAGAGDVDAAVGAARAAYESVWRDLPGRERAKYLFRIARVIQERARELAVLESLDNGKPIRESRDVDVPLAAALLLLRRLGRQARARRLRLRRPIGVAGQIIPGTSRR
jgi:aldehyde dehydrogenase (NAD+)